MPVVSHDGLSCSGLAWTFKLLRYQVNTQRLARSMLSDSPVPFRDQHMVS